MTSARAAGSSARRRPGRPRHEQPSADYVRRRQEIVDVAATLFQAKGYDAASLDDVAAALDLRKASLYYYVRSKAELLYLVFDRAISRALEDIQAIATTGSAAERLRKLIRHQVVTVASDPSLFAVFFDQRPRLESGYEGEIRDKERRYLHMYVDVVQAAIADQTITVDNPRYAAQLLLGMATWTYKWFDARRDDADAIADAAIQLVLDDAPPS
jgi:AcrR family transcriptional regulator